MNRELSTWKNEIGREVINAMVRVNESYIKSNETAIKLNEVEIKQGVLECNEEGRIRARVIPTSSTYTPYYSSSPSLSTVEENEQQDVEMSDGESITLAERLDLFSVEFSTQ